MRCCMRWRTTSLNFFCAAMQRTAKSGGVLALEVSFTFFKGTRHPPERLTEGSANDRKTFFCHTRSGSEGFLTRQHDLGVLVSRE